MTKSVSGIFPGRSDYRDTILFAFEAAPSAVAEKTYKMPKDGTVENASVRFYVGCELKVEVRLYVRRRGHDGAVEDKLIKFAPGCQDYISGDDDKFSFAVGLPVYKDDVIVVKYTNTDAVESFDVRVSVDLDYLGGEHRLPAGGVVRG